MSARAPLLTVCISTVAREGVATGEGYLPRTVDSLIARSTETERRDIEIVVINLNQQPEEHFEVGEVLARHRGRVHELVPERPAAPASRGAQGASPATMQLTRDFITTIRAGRSRGATWILRLEDDVIAAERWVPRTLRIARGRFGAGARWPFISLFSLDVGLPGTMRAYQAYAPAVLFRNDARLDRLLAVLEADVERAPVDWLLRDYRSAGDVGGVVRFPSLFQHIGVVSTLKRGRSSGLDLTSPTFADRADMLGQAAIHLQTVSRWVRRQIQRRFGR